MTYQETVDYIESVPGFTQKRSPENTRCILRLLGDPQERMKVIHVAGTNGKGSVCAYLDAILRTGSDSVGLFTSPHLVTIRERFILNGKMISEQAFTDTYEKVQSAVTAAMRDGYEHPAYFELLFIMGMVWFADQGADYLVMETGLGGLHDVTNVIQHPVLSVITSISLDHMEYLGNTVDKIARHKAGIIKNGVPVVYDGGEHVSADVIAAGAKAAGSEAVPVLPEMIRIDSRTDKSIAFVLNNRYYDNVYVTLPAAASYQAANCALAMTAVKVLSGVLGLSLGGDDQICLAVSQVHWRGRMEYVCPDVMVDGAHNIGGIKAFSDAARALAENRTVSLLFAAVMEKEYEEMIRELCRQIQWESITVTQIEGHRKVEAGRFEQLFRQYTDAPIQVVPDIRQALHMAQKSKREDTLLLCTGSLYLVGEIEDALHRMAQ